MHESRAWSSVAYLASQIVDGKEGGEGGEEEEVRKIGELGGRRASGLVRGAILRFDFFQELFIID